MIPFFEDDLVRDFHDVQLPTRTFHVDFERGIVRGFIDGADAIKQAIFLRLSVVRYEYEIYSWNYGAELRDLIGSPAPLVYVKIKNAICDALIWDDRIYRVYDFQFRREGSKVCVTFKVDTEAGLLDIERMVRVA